ncbi:c-type cytochrome [Cyanobium sp. NS01]|uniref:c-type cytochrome n=1 Tax=Cyanobium sp. NS01 TaxID=261284 RepID=UPI001CED7919|nr:c-type cytochrome [Cyanobium sp. NS01]
MPSSVLSIRPPAAQRLQEVFSRGFADVVMLVWVALVALVALVPPAHAAMTSSDGSQLFANHCAGCHIHGGNVLRRGKTLKLAALERQGVASEAAIAAIAAAGVGQMGGYANVLGEDGVQAVAAWVWDQAQAGWPRS